MLRHPRRIHQARPVAIESLEARQLLSGGGGTGWLEVPPTTPPTAATVTTPRVRSPRQAALRAAASRFGFFNGRMQTAGGVYLGAVTITVQTQISTDSFLGYFGYETGAAKQNLPVQIRVQMDGQFSLRFLSVKVAVKAQGRINLQTGEVSGQVSIWQRGSSLSGELVLSRTQALPNPRTWES